MSKLHRPAFAEMSHDESIALLERNHVGRMAFSFHDRVDIEPISYAYSDGWIYARTSPGTKIDTVEHHPWVAFEVDEVRGRFDWESVVVRGTIYLLDANISKRTEHDHAIAVLRSVDADAFKETDLVPHRTRVLRIHVDDITGRRASAAA